MTSEQVKGVGETGIDTTLAATRSSDLYTLAVSRGLYFDPKNPNGIVQVDVDLATATKEDADRCPVTASSMFHDTLDAMVKHKKEKAAAAAAAGKEGSDSDDSDGFEPTYRLEDNTDPNWTTAAIELARQELRCRESGHNTEKKEREKEDDDDDDEEEEEEDEEGGATGEQRDFKFPRCHPRWKVHPIVGTLYSESAAPRQEALGSDFSSIFREDIPVETKQQYNTSDEPSLREVMENHARWENLALRDNAFLVHNLMSPQECGLVIKSAEPHMQPVDKYFVQSYRKSDRALLFAPRLARQLYERLLPHLRPGDYKDRMPMCFGQRGVWVPFGLNECIKVTRYSEGGQFKMHRDGPWLPREDQASIYTLVLYLNEDFCAGQTYFYKSHCDVNEPKSVYGPFGCRNYLNRTLVRPTAGTAVLFNHDMWHGGEEVAGGCKWILRSEVIFQRVHSFDVDRFAFTADPAYEAMKALYVSSQLALMNGKRTEFVEQYQKVVQLQRDAMLRDARGNAKTAGNRGGLLFNGKLNVDEAATVFQFLPDSSLVTLLCVSQATYFTVIQSPVWELRCFSMFPDTFSICDPLGRLLGSAGQYKANLPLDWYTLYAQRLLAQQRKFQPIALHLRPQGVTVLTPTRLPPTKWEEEAAFGHDPFFNRFDDKLAFDVDGGSSKWTAYTLPNYFADLVGGYPFHINMADGLRFELTAETPREDSEEEQEDEAGEDEKDSRDTRGLVYDVVGGDFRPELVYSELYKWCEPVWHPLLLVGHPSWFITDGTLKSRLGTKCARDIVGELFELCRTPAIRVVHPAQAVVASLRPNTILKGSRPTEELHKRGPFFAVWMFVSSTDCNVALIDGFSLDILRHETVSFLVDDQRAAKKTGTKGKDDGKKKKKDSDQPNLFSFFGKLADDDVKRLFYLPTSAPPLVSTKAPQSGTEPCATNGPVMTVAFDAYMQPLGDDGTVKKKGARTTLGGIPIFRDEKEMREAFARWLPNLDPSILPSKLVTAREANRGIAAMCNNNDFRDRCIFRPTAVSQDLPQAIPSSARQSNSPRNPYFCRQRGSAADRRNEMICRGGMHSDVFLPSLGISTTRLGEAYLDFTSFLSQEGTGEHVLKFIHDNTYIRQCCENLPDVVVRARSTVGKCVVSWRVTADGPNNDGAEEEGIVGGKGGHTFTAWAGKSVSIDVKVHSFTLLLPRETELPEKTVAAAAQARAAVYWIEGYFNGTDDTVACSADGVSYTLTSDEKNFFDEAGSTLEVCPIPAVEARKPFVLDGAVPGAGTPGTSPKKKEEEETGGAQPSETVQGKCGCTLISHRTPLKDFSTGFGKFLDGWEQPVPRAKGKAAAASKGGNTNFKKRGQKKPKIGRNPSSQPPARMIFRLYGPKFTGCIENSEEEDDLELEDSE